MAGLAFAAACNSSDEGPSAAVDLNAAIAATATADLATLPGASTVFGFPAASLIQSVDPTKCPFTSSSQSFVCPAESRNGLTFNLSYFLLDATGNKQSSLNEATTSAVRALLDVNGTTPIENSTTAAIHHHRDFTLSGLQTTTRTLNGSSRYKDTVTTTGGSVTRRTVIDATSTTTNLSLASGSSFPSGTVTADIATSTTFGSAPAITASAHAVVTFNGTNIATARVTTGAVTSTCQIDLSGGPPRCVTE